MRDIAAGCAGIGIAALMLASTGVLAQTGATTRYPQKAIRVIVPYPASGPVDLTTRTIAPRMSEALGQPIVIDNRPGGSTIIGTELVARAPADGHTLLMVTSTISINPSVQNEIVAALAVPDVKAQFTNGGAELGGMTPEAFGQYLKGEIAKWAKAVKVAGVQPE